MCAAGTSLSARIRVSLPARLLRARWTGRSASHCSISSGPWDRGAARVRRHFSSRAIRRAPRLCLRSLSAANQVADCDQQLRVQHVLSRIIPDHLVISTFLASFRSNPYYSSFADVDIKLYVALDATPMTRRRLFGDSKGDAQPTTC